MYTLLYRINSLPVTSLRGTKQSRIYHFSIKYWIATSGIPPRNDGVFWICNDKLAKHKHLYCCMLRKLVIGRFLKPPNGGAGGGVIGSPYKFHLDKGKMTNVP